MRYDITEAEQKFSAIHTGLATLVMGAFEQYEAEKKQLISTVTQLQEQLRELRELTSSPEEEVNNDE
jgi:hypothetical protein